MNILVLNGANLNLLGTREPDIYGTATLADIEAQLKIVAATLSVHLECFQTNAEHELIDKIHAAKSARPAVDIVLINPGAFTHTSIALRDAFLGTELPFVEIHLSNLFARESFRQHSYLSDVALGVISGLGAASYEMALRWAVNKSNQQATSA